MSTIQKIKKNFQDAFEAAKVHPTLRNLMNGSNSLWNLKSGLELPKTLLQMLSDTTSLLSILFMGILALRFTAKNTYLTNRSPVDNTTPNLGKKTEKKLFNKCDIKSMKENLEFYRKNAVLDKEAKHAIALTKGMIEKAEKLLTTPKLDKSGKPMKDAAGKTIFVDINDAQSPFSDTEARLFAGMSRRLSYFKDYGHKAEDDQAQLAAGTLSLLQSARANKAIAARKTFTPAFTALFDAGSAGKPNTPAIKKAAQLARSFINNM